MTIRLGGMGEQISQDFYLHFHLLVWLIIRRRNCRFLIIINPKWTHITGLLRAKMARSPSGTAGYFNNIPWFNLLISDCFSIYNSSNSIWPGRSIPYLSIELNGVLKAPTCRRRTVCRPIRRSYTDQLGYEQCRDYLFYNDPSVPCTNVVRALFTFYSSVIFITLNIS